MGVAEGGPEMKLHKVAQAEVGNSRMCVLLKELTMDGVQSSPGGLDKARLGYSFYSAFRKSAYRAFDPPVHKTSILAWLTSHFCVWHFSWTFFFLSLARVC